MPSDPKPLNTEKDALGDPKHRQTLKTQARAQASQRAPPDSLDALTPPSTRHCFRHQPPEAWCTQAHETHHDTGSTRWGFPGGILCADAWPAALCVRLPLYNA